jgi:hypothetical protein
MFRYPAFITRLLLAALLLFGAEVLVWNNPTGKSAVDWALALPGYLVLSIVLLDFIVRYRVRDLFGVLVLAGIYSLSAALIISPQSSFVDMPRTLVTRVMGAYALLATEMIGVFLALTGGSQGRAQRFLLIGCGIVGLAWGFWVKGWPLDAGYADVSLATMLVYGLVGLALIGVIGRYAAAVSPDEMTIEALRLSRPGWGAMVIAAGTLLVIRLVRGEIETSALILTGLLLVLSWGIIWFRGRTKGPTLLDGRVPVRFPALLSFLTAAVVFMATGIFTYNLPAINVGVVTPVTVIGLGFTAYGLAWLPTVSLVLGARAYLRQFRARQV